jgi:spore maturation protein CgeB/nucleoside-diphosphate-sugar epimerase
VSAALDIVVIGLSLSSSWGNGHATTFRGLLRGLAADGHRVLFLERDVPWYASNRDLPEPDFCRLQYYRSVEELTERHGQAIRTADAVIIGSYVPDGVAVIDAVAGLQPRRLCFYDIDTPVTLGKLDRGDEEYLARRQIPGFDIYFSFSGGPLLQRLQDQYGARRAAALYCSVDADRYRNTGEQPVWDLGYLGTYSPDRQPTLEKLLLEPARQLPHLRFVVAGPQYPDDITWPANVERIEHLPPAEHPSFYSRQRFTLNVTRADMIAAGWSPSVRLFEAAACRTPIISDRWAGIGELLPPGEALLLADRSEDVVAALTTVDEAQRLSMADAAHARVAHSHTGQARARELAAALRQLSTAPDPGSKGKQSMTNDRNRSDGRTILVAGGAGFIGSHLCDALLAEGHHVICVDSFLTGTEANVAPLQNHPRFTLIEQDICTPLRLERPLHQIYNLACPASPPHYQADPVHTMQTSVVGTGNLLALAEQHGASFLQASTSEVYGDPEQHPQREDYLGHVNCTGPRACYDEGKRAAEALCFDFLRAGRVDARIARIFNTYGPRMQPDDGRIVSNLIVQALQGKPLTIYGSGGQTRSFCYVSDLVAGLVALMNVDPNPGQPVNLGNPGEFTIAELAELVRALVPGTSRIVYGPLPIDDPKRRRPDITRAATLLGWTPQVPLAKGLPLTVDWFARTLRVKSPQPAPVGSYRPQVQPAARAEA